MKPAPHTAPGPEPHGYCGCCCSIFRWCNRAAGCCDEAEYTQLCNQLLGEEDQIQNQWRRAEEREDAQRRTEERSWSKLREEETRRQRLREAAPDEDPNKQSTETQPRAVNTFSERDNLQTQWLPESVEKLGQVVAGFCRLDQDERPTENMVRTSPSLSASSRGIGEQRRDYDQATLAPIEFNFDGSWIYEKAADIIHIIKGDVIHGPDGTTIRLKVLSKDRFSIVLEGRSHEARRSGDKIYWDDGDVWIRRTPQSIPDAADSPAPAPVGPASPSAGATRVTSGSSPAKSCKSSPDTAPARASNTPPRPALTPSTPSQSPSPDTTTAAAAKPEPCTPRSQSQLKSPGESPAAATPRLSAGIFNGRWSHKKMPNTVHHIENDAIHGPDGTVLKITTYTKDGFSIEIEGETHSVRLLADELVWDDGDVWVRGQASAAFEGRWLHQTLPGIVHVVRNGKIHGPDGTTLEMTVHSKSKFSIDIQGETHYAEKVNDRITWDDGDVWIREKLPQAFFDGRWVHATIPGVLHVIKGDIIYGPDGTNLRLTAQSKDSFSIDLQGEIHVAQLVGDQIVWDDGDIWTLEQDRGRVEQEDADCSEALWIAEVRRIATDRERTVVEASSPTSSPLPRRLRDSEETSVGVQLTPNSRGASSPMPSAVMPTPTLLQEVACPGDTQDEKAATEAQVVEMSRATDEKEGEPNETPIEKLQQDHQLNSEEQHALSGVEAEASGSSCLEPPVSADADQGAPTVAAEVDEEAAAVAETASQAALADAGAEAETADKAASALGGGDRVPSRAREDSFPMHAGRSSGSRIRSRACSLEPSGFRRTGAATDRHSFGVDKGPRPPDEAGSAASSGRTGRRALSMEPLRGRG